MLEPIRIPRATARDGSPLLAAALLLLVACAGTHPGSASAPSGGERRHLLEQVDEAAVVQLYADSFAELSPREKILAYHLQEAVLAGRDIFIDQRCRHALEVRGLIEEILVHPEGIDPATLAEIRRYTKLFWLNNGPYNNLTARKFVLRTEPEAFEAAATRAERTGAGLPKRDGETTAQMLERLRPILFDPDFEPVVTNKNPGEGRDILEASAVNFYRGLTLKDLEGFQEGAPLNSTLVKRPDGAVEELIWRCGDGKDFPPGLYAKEIAAIVRHLEGAIPFAPPGTAEALRKLIRWYQTGEERDFREYCIAWVADKDGSVDTINGFIEVYMDPRGRKGSWEGLVFARNPSKMRTIRSLAENAQWFEDRMPWDPKYRKPEVKGIVASAIDVIVEAGDSGPVTPIGINLPNPQDIRERYGSKSVQLSNVIEGYEKSRPKEFRREFCATGAELERAEKWSTLVDELEVAMHEAIGHASGRSAETLEGDPAGHIKEYYSALEEGRADLVALWFIGDPRLRDLGLVPDPEVELAAYEGYTRNALVQLRRVREGSQLEEDHMRNRQMIVHWLMDRTRAIEVARRDGKTFYRVADSAAWKEGVGRLLAEVQRIKSEGDYRAAKELFDAYGIRFDPRLRDEVVRRVEALDLPSYTGFVMPRLTAVRNASGEIVDVEISYPCDLETQMLEWSGRREAPSRAAVPAGG